MPKITFVGAGSTVFAQNLVYDILSFPELADSVITLHDIDIDRLKTSEIAGHKIVKSLNINATIVATNDRRVIYGNVTNNGIIDNLPQDTCVEVPCTIDKNGIQPHKIGNR